MVSQLEKKSASFTEVALQERALLGPARIDAILDEGRQYSLAPVLCDRGALCFPHSYIDRCGYQMAACVHALLDSGADQALILGVLHPFANELERAYSRFLHGGDIKGEKVRGVQGPGLEQGAEWEDEYSLLNFLYLLDLEVKKRGVKRPKVWMRYPYLVGSEPKSLKGITELEELAKDCALLVTGDLLHDGIGYGTSTDALIDPEDGGTDQARVRIDGALQMLGQGDYEAFFALSREAKSDFWNVGPVLHHLLGSFKADILDITWADTTEFYDAPLFHWVAPSLIAFHRTTVC